MLYLAILVLLVLPSVTAKFYPFRNGVFIWGLTGNCDFNGGTCGYVPNSMTTCQNAACDMAIYNLAMQNGVDYVASMVVPANLTLPINLKQYTPRTLHAFISETLHTAAISDKR